MSAVEPEPAAAVADEFTPAYAATLDRGRVAAWAMWDWGSSAFNAVVTSFVFATYLARSVAVNGAPAGARSGTSWIAIASAASAILIALAAPVMGQRSDAGGHRKRNLLILTGLVVLCMYAMFFVRNDYSFLWLGLVLLSLGSVFSEIASVSYNAMLNQVSTPRTAGRVSGIGWAAGYVGGIVLLLILFVGLISPKVGWFGVTSEHGLNIRVAMLFAATWFALSSIPLMLKVPEVAAAPGQVKIGIRASYRKLITDITQLWKADRNAVKFLIASALYRDGLAAVFSFGAVLAGTVWGLSSSQVILFGIAANVIAAVGAFLGGLFDDRLGPKVIVMVAIVGLVVACTVLLFVHSTTLFWVFGLMLSLWVGPAQSSSRVFMSRVAPAGKEGQMFGLYATTGRAVSFLAPTLVYIFTTVSHADRSAIAAIALVLIIGLIALTQVRAPVQGRAVDHVEQVTSQV